MDDRHCQAFLKVSDACSVRKKVAHSTGSRDGGDFFLKKKYN